MADRSTATASASRAMVSTKPFGCLEVSELPYAPMGFWGGREVVLAESLYCRPQAIPPQMPPIASDAISSEVTFSGRNHTDRVRSLAAFYIDAVVKPFNSNQSYQPGWQLPLASGTACLERPSIRAGSLTGHIMPSSLKRSWKLWRAPHLTLGNSIRPGGLTSGSHQPGSCGYLSIPQHVTLQHSSPTAAHQMTGVLLAIPTGMTHKDPMINRHPILQPSDGNPILGDAAALAIPAWRLQRGLDRISPH